MRFDNVTAFPATLLRSAEDDHSVRMLAVAAITCAIERNGLRVSAEQRPLETAADTPYPNDVDMSRAGLTSVCVTGHAYPEHAGDRESMVRLRVGECDLDIRVLGERRWRRGIDLAPTPSRAQPIDRVPMAWTHAFGGRVTREPSWISVHGERAILCGHEACFPLNADGRGFALSAEEAIDRPLPQLEDPARPLERWDDYPEPLCLAPYPMSGGLRAGFILKDGKIDKSQLPRLHSRAAPRTTFAPLPAGTTIAVVGMTRPDALVFSLPEAPLSLDVSVGDDRETLPLSLDAVDIDAEARTVRLLYRAACRYDLFQFERRESVLRSAGSPTPGRLLG